MELFFNKSLWISINLNKKEKYLFNEELDKTRRIPERLKFVDIYVENVHIEIEKESELYKKLIKIMKIN